jgi:hypothetical protein
MRCPKCGTRIRHHKDGTVELLTVGAPPPPPAPSAAATEPAAPSVEAATAPAPGAEAAPLKESTAVLAAVADKFLSSGEAKQNTYVIWGVIGFLVVVLSGIGLMISEPIVAAAPPALALVAAFVWLYMRKMKHDAAERVRQAAKHGLKDGEKTEPIPR